ncbi:major facilitator superfamily domain-containing protein [Lipomyces tetrasporus]|uniref:Major facilitator superfamily domain-containing protein n=1 Tax=Lipomyces tetrasporus TaxID=54092 RepID=A0AAD7VW55_9ASCO|nr:major facilitator superfamily domain-containing protein [Lipomyces tetrasporus]KAJ8103781.1 major facilitator superfamily domain-containing protein [Lipomyces tetrasporus]
MTTSTDSLSTASECTQQTEQTLRDPVADEKMVQSENEKLDPEELIDYPDGGLKAWSVVFGSWCAMLGCFGIWNSVGVFQAYLSENQLSHYTEGDISWIFSVFSFLFFFCGVQIGPIFDTYGLKPLVIPGSIGFSLSIMLFSLSNEYYQFFLSFSVLGGISCSLLFTPAIAAVNQWFNVRRGLATGIATTGGGFGGVIFPIVVRDLIPKVGFGWALRIVGFICLVTSTLAVLCLRTRFPSNKASSATIDLSSFKDRRFAATACATFMIEWALQIPQTYFTSFALYKNVDSTFAYQMIAILNGASVLGRWLPGYIADRFGRFNTMIATIFMCAVFSLSLWMASAAVDGTNTGLMIAYMVCFGFASGSGISLTPVCLAQISDMREYGKRYGTTFSFASLGTLTGVPIAGAILKAQNGRYEGLIGFCGACYMVCLMFLILARGFGGGWKLRTVY